MRLLQKTPLHLYVHIPFCVHKCHYCDFNSHERQSPPWDEYQAALIAELEQHAKATDFAGRNLETLFFGGGTPSLAPPALVKAIIHSANQYFGFEDNAEITLEANPGTADAENFLGYRQAGVNRLSIGVQSMHDGELRWLERIHDRDQALQAFAIARQTGFDNINLDLMYGLPGQDMADWLQTLQTAIALSPEHLSCYQLSVEPHTRLAARHNKNPYALPDDELALDFFNRTRQTLHHADYSAYEISNFARSSKHCRHNDGYWLYHDYIGIGASAAGKRDLSDGSIRRYSNTRSPEHYVRAALAGKTVVHRQEKLNLEQAAAEAVWLGLRRTGGISRPQFKDRFSFDAWTMFSADLRQWQEAGKLAVSDSHICLTTEGLPLADAIAASVLNVTG